MEISCLVDPQKYIGIGVHRFYGGKEDTIRIFSWYTLMDTPTGVHHSRKTKDICHGHLFAQSFQDTDQYSIHITFLL